MKTKYLNYLQASIICTEHQHLIGSLFDPACPESGIVRDVLIAPYSRILQWDFVRRITKGEDAATVAALYANGRFDVLVLSSQIMDSNRSFRMLDLRSFLARQGMPFHPERYHCLRNYS